MEEESFSNNNTEVFSFVFDYLNFGRFDAGGVLHHAGYYHLLEDLRERYLITNGLSYKSLMDQGYHLPLVESKQNFIKPIFYNEKITGHLFIRDLSRSTITFEHNLKNQKEETVHNTTTKHVVVKSVDNKFKPCAVPDQLRKILEA